MTEIVIGKKSKKYRHSFDELEQKREFDAGFWSFNVGTVLISCFFIYLFFSPATLASLTQNKSPQAAFLAALSFTIFFMNVSFWAGRLIIWLKYR